MKAVTSAQIMVHDLKWEEGKERLPRVMAFAEWAFGSEHCGVYGANGAEVGGGHGQLWPGEGRKEKKACPTRIACWGGCGASPIGTKRTGRAGGLLAALSGSSAL